MNPGDGGWVPAPWNCGPLGPGLDTLFHQPHVPRFPTTSDVTTCRCSSEDREERDQGAEAHPLSPEARRGASVASLGGLSGNRF